MSIIYPQNNEILFLIPEVFEFSFSPLRKLKKKKNIHGTNNQKELILIFLNLSILNLSILFKNKTGFYICILNLHENARINIMHFQEILYNK